MLDRRAPLSPLLLAALIACGGGSDPTGPGSPPSPGPPPATGPVAAVTLSPASQQILTDDQLTLTAKLTNADGAVLTGRTVTWASSADSVATVSDSGVVSAVAPGDATITATSEGKSGTTSLAVRIRFVEAAVGKDHTCALTAAGTAWCWGLNLSGQLGSGAPTTATASTPSRVAGSHRFSAIAAGYAHTCALDTMGAAWCWGSDQWGQLGDHTLDNVQKSTPVAVVGGNTYVAVTAGYYHTCALETDGTAWCWGNNENGQVKGIAAPDFVTLPVAVKAPTDLAAPISFTLIGAGAGFTCGAAGDADGDQLWCWGNGTFGQLGPGGNFADLHDLGNVLVRATHLTVGAFHSYAVGLGGRPARRDPLIRDAG